MSKAFNGKVVAVAPVGHIKFAHLIGQKLYDQWWLGQQYQNCQTNQLHGKAASA